MRSQLNKISLGLLTSAIVLTSLEILDRTAETVYQDMDEQTELAPQWLTRSPDLGWERKPFFEGYVGYADRQFDGAGYFAADSAQVAAVTGSKKVVFLGDSNTFGYGVPTPDSFVEVTDRLLPGVDTINLGVVGYSSYQGRVTFEKYIPTLKPDLVVVSFNFNDRRSVVPPEGRDSRQEFQRVYRLSQSMLATSMRVVELSHFSRWMRRVLRRVGLLPQSVDRVQVTDLEPRVDEEAYRRNLSFIVAEAKRLNIPVLFLQLGDDPLLSDHLHRGIASLEKRDYDTAIAYLNSAVRSRSMFSELARVYLARAYDAKGDRARAAESVEVRSIYRSWSGGTLIRLASDYNAIMRQVAAENNAQLLDGAAVLENHPTVFIDFCHFNIDGHRLLAERLAAQIVEVLALPGS